MHVSTLFCIREVLSLQALFRLRDVARLFSAGCLNFFARTICKLNVLLLWSCQAATVFRNYFLNGVGQGRGQQAATNLEAQEMHACLIVDVGRMRSYHIRCASNLIIIALPRLDSGTSASWT